MIIIKKFTFSDEKLASLARTIRETVFVNEQGVSPELEYDGKDADAIHYLLYYKDLPVATARWRETEDGIKLERFAMLQKYRNNGYGKLLLEEVMSDVRKENKRIYLHAQKKAVNYYLRCGFKIVGNPFYEASICHYKMIWKG